MAQLPDGNEIQVGVDRFAIPEIMFQPVYLFSSLALCSLACARAAMFV